MESADMEQQIRATHLTGRSHRGRGRVERWTSEVNESFDEWAVDARPWRTA